jgi:hypothetical protein
MFNFLKKLKGGGNGRVTRTAESVDMDADVEIMKIEAGDIVLRSVVLFPLNKTLDVTVSIPQPDGSLKRRRAELKLVDCRLLDDEMREYDGVLEDVSPEMETFLLQRAEEQASERRKKSGADQRGGDRATLTFAVISRAFKNFKAVSADISPSGVKIMVDGEVEVGKNIEITMNLDDDNFGSLTCHADVMWCRPAERKFAIGLRFSDLTEAQKETINNYMKFVEEYTARVLRRPIG